MRCQNPPSQTWKTFLPNHAEAINDMCIVPTLTRQLLWFGVTRHPTAESLARQITEAFPWASALAYLVCDNDRACEHIFMSRVRAMGIRDRPIRECLDQMFIFDEEHLRRVLSAYAAHYNQARMHVLRMDVYAFQSSNAPARSDGSESKTVLPENHISGRLFGSRSAPHGTNRQNC
jgi:hypothetical protein